MQELIQSEETMIRVEDISKDLKNHRVLNHVSLTCKRGRIYGLVGYNGSGKTVLMKCICGFFYPDSGNIYISGKKLGKDISMLSNAGIMIEEPGYISNMSGYANLCYLWRIRNKPDKKHLYDVMKMVGLDPLSSKKVRNYSLGMKQRLAIAQAIMENPEILILDEPMNGLDKNGVEEMRKLFLQLRDEGKCIIISSHNQEDIKIMCDEIVQIEDGAIIVSESR